MENLTFLDLEGTLIDAWDNPIIVNEPAVNEFLEWQRRDAGLDRNATLPVELFSFAIGGDEDRIKFNDTYGPWLEDKYNLKFTHVHTCKEMSKEISYFMGVKFEHDYEAITLLGKGRMFIEFMQGIHLQRKFKTATLFDDVVTTSQFRLFHKDIDLRLIRVDDLTEKE